MSKGSMWWGNATGKVGQTVLSVLKGQQIARAYQPNVGNPKTEAQILQRAKFATAVKFYKSAVLGSFKFAFENKNPTESDYNAFMRVNKGSNLLINRAAYTNPYYPVVAPWIMSEGSLSRIMVDSTQGDDNVRFHLGAHDSNITTVQGLARQLCVANNLPGSTIFTVVFISNGIGDVRDYETDIPSSYSIAQFQDGQVSDTRTLAQLATELGTGSIVASSSTQYVDFDIADGVQAIAIIPTLQTANGLRVGASQLQLNDGASEFMANCIESGYIAEALTSWGATGKAILQGALLPESAALAVAELSSPFVLCEPEDSNEITMSVVSGPSLGDPKLGDTMTIEVNGVDLTAEIVDEDSLNYQLPAPYGSLEIEFVSKSTINITNSADAYVALSFKKIVVNGVPYTIAR